MQSVAAVIATSKLEDEIARLRLIIGGLREELWDTVWAGLFMDEQRYKDQTEKLIYGSHNE
jgi:hypothetical protein